MLLVKAFAPGTAAVGATYGLVQFSICLARALSPTFARYVLLVFVPGEPPLKRSLVLYMQFLINIHFLAGMLGL
jgi:hypothetical protein